MLQCFRGDSPMKSRMTRRQVLASAGKAALAAPLLEKSIVSAVAAAETTPLQGLAGIDRVTILPGKTYLRGWAGFGDPPRLNRPRNFNAPPPPPPAETGPAPTVTWSKASGPGEVTFADPKTAITTATFSAPGQLRAADVRRQRQDHQHLRPECVGRNPAARQAARRRLHQEFQDRQPASGTRAPRR